MLNKLHTIYFCQKITFLILGRTRIQDERCCNGTHCTLSVVRFGDVAAVVRSSTISSLNNRTNKRNKERGVKKIELLHIAVQ